MKLQCRLRREQDARAAADRHVLMQAIAGEHTWRRAHEHHVGGAADVKAPADSKRRLGVGVGEDRAAATVLERQLQPRVTTYDGGNTTIAG